jgi:hypothetical protein
MLKELSLGLATLICEKAWKGRPSHQRKFWVGWGLEKHSSDQPLFFFFLSSFGEANEYKPLPHVRPIAASFCGAMEGKNTNPTLDAVRSMHAAVRGLPKGLEGVQKRIMTMVETGAQAAEKRANELLEQQRSSFENTISSLSEQLKTSVEGSEVLKSQVEELKKLLVAEKATSEALSAEGQSKANEEQKVRGQCDFKFTNLCTRSSAR